MTTKHIDILNICLVIISLMIAIKIPFELFLFSYAVLGPLHYLTEINWLREKKYFISANTNWTLIFIISAVLISIYPIIQFTGLEMNKWLDNIIKFIRQQTYAFILIGFLFAVSLTFFKTIKSLSLALIVVFFISYFAINNFPRLALFIGIFLPTVIHVYIFTIFFIFYGALKTKSNLGFYLCILLIMVPVIISYIPMDYIYLNYNPHKESIENFTNGGFKSVNLLLAQLLSELQTQEFRLLSELGLRIQIFIAFAYTYHYLNWFSKTSIIGWKKAISKKGFFLILSLWIVSVGLYVYDFKTGIIALFLLSLVHVFLEFPLNVITIKESLLLTKRKLP